MKIMLNTIVALTLSTGTAYAGTASSQAMFERIDANGDGHLTVEEVRSNPGPIRYSNLYPRGSFSLADINGDGVLNREEFQANEEDIPAE